MLRSSCSMMRISTLLSRVRIHMDHPRLLLNSLRIGAIACKFRGTGQTCVCANRIFVQSSIYAEFASRLAERVAAFKVGNGLDKET